MGVEWWELLENLTHCEWQIKNKFGTNEVWHKIYLHFTHFSV